MDIRLASFRHASVWVPEECLVREHWGRNFIRPLVRPFIARLTRVDDVSAHGHRHHGRDSAWRAVAPARFAQESSTAVDWYIESPPGETWQQVGSLCAQWLQANSALAVFGYSEGEAVIHATIVDAASSGGQETFVPLKQIARRRRTCRTRRHGELAARHTAFAARCSRSASILKA